MSDKRSPSDGIKLLKRAQTISESPPVPVVFRGRKQRYLEARIMLGTVTEAAAATGYNRSNAHRIEKDPAFKAALDKIVAERIADARAEVEGLLPLAVRRLGDILADPRAKDSDVISAARELLDRGGLPKTERVEHSGEVTDGDARRDPDEVMARLTVLRGGLDG